MLYLQIASPKSSVLNFLDSNSFEVIISIFQRTEKVPDMERLRNDEGTEIFIISIGLRTFQKAESALFDLVLQAVNEGEVSMGTDHDSGEISVAV